MSHSCLQWRGEIGAYVVGALDGCASDQVSRHIAACAGCRTDYDELVPVREWLGLLGVTAGWPKLGPYEAPGRTRHDSFRDGPRTAAGALPATQFDGALVPRMRRSSGTVFSAHPRGKLRSIGQRTRRWLPRRVSC
jgi:anti-sigma factor RsiW